MAIPISNTGPQRPFISRTFVHLALALAAGGCVVARTPATPTLLSSSSPTATADPVTTPADPFADWLREHLPTGGKVVTREGGSVGIDHAVQENQTLQDVADAYLDLDSIYLAEDLARAIRDENQIAKGATLTTGTTLRIPELISAIPKTPAEARLGWSETDGLRGVYVRAFLAARKGFLPMLDMMAARGMNLAVIDVKDANGRLTYPSKVALANEIGAVASPQIKNLSRTIEFAHSRGIRVAMRIVCFADDLLSVKRSELGVQNAQRRPLHMGWMDPSNQIVQQYIVDLATEAVEAGADEIQLDYVRYPVEKVENADFRLKERNLRRTEVIRDFVRKVHTVTQAHSVPLSIDIFGIVAEGVKTDIENLGQDPRLLAQECEALSPMLYPSHYPKGFHGFEQPGAHPELVRTGVSNLISLIRKGQASREEGASEKSAVIRPWIQGMPWHAPTFGPQYIADQVSHADKAGATGWILWNPSQDYTATWQGIPLSAGKGRNHRADAESKPESK